ncbi:MULTISPECIES: hypothetical protein [Marinomonas]|uniref:Uncharacterized protein n=1 Tax=Marinomonas rhodophyticola TaxID=2992803 RepID=A0ABT3KEL4_9GAMM|nr:hypothetical protein [Marinomonas sp. KJ51-3]MCW4628606.1 hypothetical protein [Marinomonas sp. KJ51-3]
MKLTPIFVASFVIATTYTWWQNDKTITVTLPSDDQRKEMIGTSNTPSIPLTPIQN